MSFDCWVPALLDRRALHYDGNAGEQGDYDGDDKADMDECDLDLVADDSEEECANSQLAHPDDHNPSNLTEQFILDSLKVYGHIPDIRGQPSQSIVACNTDEDGVDGMKDLGHVSFHSGNSSFCSPGRDNTDSHQHQQHSIYAVVYRI